MHPPLQICPERIFGIDSRLSPIHRKRITMPTTSGGNPAALRRLAALLEQIRGSRTRAEVTSALGWSLPKLGRLERAQDIKPMRDKVGQLLDYYGIHGPQRD